MMTDRSFKRLAAMVVLLTRKKETGLWALNKLLWFADVAHLLEHGRTISGAAYSCHGFGPAPLGIHTVRRVLIKKALLKECVRESERFRVFAYKAKTKNIHVGLLRQEFEPSELDMLNSVIRKLGNRPGTYLHSMSLEFEPWLSARPGQDVDLHRARIDAKLRQWMGSIGLLRPAVEGSRTIRGH